MNDHLHTENCDPEFGCDAACATPLPPDEAIRRVLALADELPPNLVWGADVADEIRADVAGKRWVPRGASSVGGAEPVRTVTEERA